MEADERVGMIEEYLGTPLPDGWGDMDLYAHRNYLSGTEFGTPAHTGKTIRTEVSNAEIWCECFGKPKEDIKPADSYAISAIMTRLGEWEKTGKTMRLSIYGKQRVYSCK